MTTKIYVISGAPCTGKTTIINELKAKNHNILEEGASEVGKLLKETGEKEAKFHKLLAEFRINQIEKIKNQEKIYFSDRGLIDNIAFCKFYASDPPPNLLSYLKSFKYAKVFILEPLKFYENNETRQFPKEKQEEIQEELITQYKKFGYAPIKVPVMPLKDRVNFILSKLY